jgi:hypothetical protein
MMSYHGEHLSHVGEVVSLAPLGHATTGKVLAQSWSPALGEVLRVQEERNGQPTSTILLYGDLLEQLFPDHVTAPAL